MPSQQPLLKALNHARRYTLALTADFESEDQWMKTLPGSPNHAIWILGHLTVVDNSLLGYIEPAWKQDLGNYGPLFGKGSVPTDQRSDYPEISELRNSLNTQRERVIEVLNSLDESRFEEPTIDSAPEFLPTVGSIFHLLAWHEGLHSGQLSMIHRSLGFAALR